MITLLKIILVIIGGSWLTSSAMLGERKQWLRPFIMFIGLAITILALLAVLMSAAQGEISS